MGTWGPGLFENDVAADVKAAFADALEAGESVPDAIDAVMDAFGEALDDPDDRADIVLSLAWLASALGDVTTEIKRDAIEVIRSGQSMGRWEVSADVEARRAEEQRLLDILEGRARHPGI